MTRLTLDELARLDELQSAYMSALDGKKMRSWLDTFEDDPSASYICIARNDVESGLRSEEHTSELQSLMRISYAVICLTNKNTQPIITDHHPHPHSKQP